MGFGVWGLGLGVSVSGLRILVSDFGIRDSGSSLWFLGEGAGLRVQGSRSASNEGKRRGFQVSSFGIWVPDFDFRFSGSRFRGSGSGFRDSGLGIRDSGFRFLVSGFAFRASVRGFGSRVSGFRVSGVGVPEKNGRGARPRACVAKPPSPESTRPLVPAISCDGCLVFGVWCLVFGVWCLVFGVWCVAFGVWWLVFMDNGTDSGFGVQT